MTAPIVNDPDWDWIPIESGSEISMGDRVLWASGYQFVVADITLSANDEGGTTYTFSDGGSVAVEVDVPPLTEALQYQRSQYLVTAHPAVGTRFRNQDDDSLWIFQQSKTYRCWQAGSLYPAGMVLTRPYMTGTLVEL